MSQNLKKKIMVDLSGRIFISALDTGPAASVDSLPCVYLFFEWFEMSKTVIFHPSHCPYHILYHQLSALVSFGECDDMMQN